MHRLHAAGGIPGRDPLTRPPNLRPRLRVAAIAVLALAVAVLTAMLVLGDEQHLIAIDVSAGKRNQRSRQ